MLVLFSFNDVDVYAMIAVLALADINTVFSIVGIPEVYAQETATITGYKWNDADADDKRDGGEVRGRWSRDMCRYDA